MAIWYPPPEIAGSEIVGRRLMDKTSVQRGTNNAGRPLFQLNDFYESRLADDLSVDRLGDRNPSRETLKKITSLADADANTRQPAFTFSGWAKIRVEIFCFPGWTAKIIAAPTQNAAGDIDNRWHAEVSLEGFREKASAYAHAAALQHTFERKGAYEAPRR